MKKNEINFDWRLSGIFYLYCQLLKYLKDLIIINLNNILLLV